MVLTVYEAKEKHCPFCFSNPEDGSKCIANEYMAWRWWEIVIGKDQNERRGYCGLAGQTIIAR